MHNDYSAFTREGLKELINDIQSNVREKPLMFFQNTKSNQHHIFCDNLDSFTNIARLDSAWIGSYGYWKDDYMSIFPKDEKIATQFMQLDWFLKIFDKKKSCLVYRFTFTEKLYFNSKHGDYNMFKIKVVNFLGMYKPYVKKEIISRATYENVQKDVYRNLLGWIYRIYIKKDKNYAYSSEGAFSLLYKEFGKCYWFYTELILFPMKKFLSNPLKYLNSK